MNPPNGDPTNTLLEGQFEPVVAQNQVLLNFGEANQEVLNEDLSSLRVVIRETIDEILNGNVKALDEVSATFKQQLAKIFAAHPLYVLFEKQLDCNVQTDHLAPKDVYPVYEAQLEAFIEDVAKVVRALVSHELIIAADKINEAVRLVLTETTEANELLLIRLVFNQQESEKFKDLFDTNVTKFVNQEQNLKRYIQLLREQVHQSGTIGRAFEADFSKEKSAALEYKDNIILSTDRLRELELRNTQLEKEVIKLTGELEKQRTTSERLQEYARQICALERENDFFRQQISDLSKQKACDNERLAQLGEQVTEAARIIDCYEDRLRMYRDEPQEVAANTAQWLTDEQLESKFSLRPEYSEHDVITDMRLYDIQDLEHMEFKAQQLENELAKTMAYSAKGAGPSCDKHVEVDEMQHSQTGNKIAAEESQITAYERQVESDRAEIERLNGELESYIDKLQNDDKTELYAKAIDAGLRSLRIRDVECQTDLDEIRVVDHAERLQEFIQQNENLSADLKQRAIKASKKEPKTSVANSTKIEASKEVRPGFELVFIEEKTGELFDSNYNALGKVCLLEAELAELRAMPVDEGLEKASNSNFAAASETIGSAEFDNSSAFKQSVQEANAFAQTDDSAEELCDNLAENAEELLNLLGKLSNLEEIRFLDMIRAKSMSNIEPDLEVVRSIASEGTEVPEKEKAESCLANRVPTATESNEEAPLAIQAKAEDQQPHGQVYTFNDTELLKEQAEVEKLRESSFTDQFLLFEKQEAADMAYSSHTNTTGDNKELKALEELRKLDLENIENGFADEEETEHNSALSIAKEDARVMLLSNGDSDAFINQRYVDAVNRHLTADMEIKETATVFETFRELQENIRRGEERKQQQIAEAKQMQLLYWSRITQASGTDFKATTLQTSGLQDLLPIKLRTIFEAPHRSRSSAQSYDKVPSLPVSFPAKFSKLQYSSTTFAEDVKPDTKMHKNQLLDVKAVMSDVNATKSAMLPSTQLSASRGMVGRSLSEKK